MYVSGSVPVYVCTLSHTQPHTHAHMHTHTHIHSHPHFDTSSKKNKYTIGKLAKNAMKYINSRSGAGVQPDRFGPAAYAH